MKFISTRPRGALISVAGLFGVLDTWGHLGAYVQLPFVDIITHFLFGAGLALFLIHARIIGKRTGVFLAVAFAGISWEAIEFVYDHFVAMPYGTPISQHGIDDTLLDLLSSTFGSLVSIFVFLPAPAQVQEGAKASVSEPK